jgi:ferredoxin
MGFLPTVSAGVGGFLFLLTLWAALVSRGEGETRAASILGILAVFVAAPFFLPLLGTEAQRGPLALTFLLMVLGAGLALLIPWRGRGLPRFGDPAPGVDERDIMFSRALLVPGTQRFEEYYKSRPQNRAPDDEFRKEPGLLSPGTVHFHEQGYAAADAAFWTIEMLRPFVEGEAGGGEGTHAGSSGFKLGGEQDPRTPDERELSDPAAMSRFLKAWGLKMGAHSVGMTELRDYHKYSHIGRGDGFGEEVDLDHPFAIAFTVEMDKEMVDQAPRAATAMETAFQYLRGGVLAVLMADLIRRLGYQARAHVDGLYRVICPLVARDAGLGELGRMGLLMTPGLGPRVRIAVVTTDLPMALDGRADDPTTIDFCLRCKKCADCCPSNAISFGPPEKDENGVLRWRIDSEACFTLWGKLGTDCARCMAVCPYSHDANAMHSFVRWGLRHNKLFRRGSLWMDDLIYGRNPPPKEELEWMNVSELTGPHE